MAAAQDAQTQFFLVSEDASYVSEDASYRNYVRSKVDVRQMFQRALDARELDLDRIEEAEMRHLYPARALEAATATVLTCMAVASAVAYDIPKTSLSACKIPLSVVVSNDRTHAYCVKDANVEGIDMLKRGYSLSETRSRYSCDGRPSLNYNEVKLLTNRDRIHSSLYCIVGEIDAGEGRAAVKDISPEVSAASPRPSAPSRPVVAPAAQPPAPVAAKPLAPPQPAYSSPTDMFQKLTAPQQNQVEARLPEPKTLREKQQIAESCLELVSSRKVLSDCDFQQGVPMFRNVIRIPPAAAHECPEEVPYQYRQQSDGSISSGYATVKPTTVESCAGPIADLRVKPE